MPDEGSRDSSAAPGEPIEATPTPSLTVIIPTAGRPRLLLDLLRALALQTLAPQEFEVVVTDDGSDPPVEPALLGLNLPYRLHCRAQPSSGPAAARNRAVEVARGRYLLFLNDDAGPPPDLLERHLQSQRSSPTPRAWLGRFDFAPECLSPLAVALDELGLLFPYQRMRSKGGNPGQFFWTCNLSVPRDAVVAAGGFDEQFKKPVSGDVELGYRLEKRGVAVHLLAGAGCRHHHRVDARWFLERQVELGLALVRFWRKHRDPEHFPWIRDAGGDEALLVAGIEREAAARGLAIEVHRNRIDAIDAGAAASGAYDEEVGTRAAELAPHLKQMNEDAVRLGVLAGLKGWDAPKAWEWLRGLPSLTTLFFEAGVRDQERGLRIDRVRALAGCPVEVAELPAADESNRRSLREQIFARALGERVCLVDPVFEPTPGWLCEALQKAGRGAHSEPGRFRLVSIEALHASAATPRTSRATPRNVVDELIRFTGKSRAFVEASMRTKIEGTALSYRAKAGTDEDWYGETDAYLYELANWEGEPLKQRLVDSLARRRGEFRLPLLDYGCGIGTFAIALAEAGLSVVACDLNRRNTEFLRFRARERGLARRIEVTDTVSALERPGRYSVVSCQHVLEHVADPRALLASLRDSLEEGGLFIGVAPFSLVNDEFPEHRLENAHLRLEDLLQEQGFDLCGIAPFGTSRDYVFELVSARKRPLRVPANWQLVVSSSAPLDER